MDFSTGAEWAEAQRQRKSLSRTGILTQLWHCLFLSGVVVALALACFGIQQVTPIGYVFVGYVFLLGVVLGSLRFGRGPVLIMATFSAAVWDYLFIPPKFNLGITNLDDQVMVVMFFIVALSMGHLTTRLRLREEAERRLRRHTSALLTITESAALAANPEKGLTEALGHITSVLQATTCLVLADKDPKKLASDCHPASRFAPTGDNWAAARWAFEHQTPAGHFTKDVAHADATWYPLQTATALLGVLGVRLLYAEAIDPLRRQTIESFALQLALVLEKERFVEVIKDAEVVARSEKLHRTLLDSLSHELKTPLAIIQGSLEGFDDPSNPYLTEIRTANQRLQRIVNGLMLMSRLEADAVHPHREWCDMSEVIQTALEDAAGVLLRRTVLLEMPDDLPLVKLDQLLLTHAVANVLHNAGFHTPQGANIHVQVEFVGSILRIRVRDEGPGLLPDTEEKIFEKFYRGASAHAGGTGLGLAIARGFARAEGGNITARNHPDGGAEFLLEFTAESLNERDVDPGH